ncbi:MAG: hypothetical protein ACJA08_002463 [Cyclobacteriaceae bacterium]|jgi:hypothetical protein
MGKSFVLLFILLFANFALSAQFFSGYFVSDVPIDDFEHLKIHHHHSSHHKYEGNLMVKGFSEHGEIWEMNAEMITGDKADFFIKEFGGDYSIVTVYEIKIYFDGIEEDFILMGYEESDGHPAFVVVEEVYSDEDESNLIKLKSFKLKKAHHMEK